ncbi:MAG TPA: hypothetical protein VH478_23425 [Trebonia sp.]|jgi:hypothetical protein|nr:hypothetical protein [Trebonia sp.]
MATWVWILIAIVVVVIVGLAVVAARQRRSAALRERFGPEYDRAVASTEDRRAAEAELRERERQHSLLELKELPEAERARYAHDWQGIQEHFIDEPVEAVVSADGLVYSVMEARGYPMGDFDTQADLVSVDHPAVVDNYRFAHGVRERAQAQQASTEDLRDALLRYRSLFSELLGVPEDQVRVNATSRRTVTGNEEDVPDEQL